MGIPIAYVTRNFFARRLTAGMTIIGIALVVFVLTAVLMMAFGVEKTLRSTGSKDNVIIYRKSSQGEITSIIPREAAKIITSFSEIAKDTDGQALATTEPVAVINLDKKDGGMSNITVRGVTNKALKLRPKIKITEGRMFNFGSRELIVGASINKNFASSNIGDRVKFAGDFWTIVGKFDADKTAFDSELWGDETQLLQAFNRDAFSIILVQLTSPEMKDAFNARLQGDKRLKEFEAEVEPAYYEKQAGALTMFIRIVGNFVTIIFSFGAIIGAMITMYAAVANRIVEIGTLRALGFQRSDVLMAFLLESLLLAGVGGVVGVLLASTLQFFEVSALNFASFSELAFGFSLSPEIVITSLIFSVFMGFIGGFLPAVRASRLSIVDALRG